MPDFRVIEQKINKINFQQLPLVHAVIGLIFVFSRNYPIEFILIPCTLFFMLKHLCVVYLWIITVGYLLIMKDFRLFLQYGWVSFSNMPSYFEFILVMTWLFVRYTSFVFDYNLETLHAKNDAKRLSQMKRKYSLINYLGYVFYFPIILHGPPMVFERYASLFERKTKLNGLFSRLKVFGLHIIRIICWGFVAEILRHFIYTNYVTEYIDVRECKYFTICVHLTFDILSFSACI